jgi:dTMP kinase
VKEIGSLVVFEGVGNAGKGTQIRLASGLLRRNGYDVLTFREPGGTGVGEDIRELIFDLRREHLITPGEQMVLFFASRRALLKEVINPGLAQGKLILGDRFYTSTGAYQGYAEGGDMEKILALIRVGLKGFKPDAVILLDVSPETAMAREKKENDDPYDRNLPDYYRRLVAGYREMAASGWGDMKWYKVDGEPAIKQVLEEVRAVLEEILQRKLGK